MDKQAFLARLEGALAALPRAERDERLAFYAECIDDRMEEGLSESEAVAALGDVDEIVSQILEDTPLRTLVKGARAERRLQAWEIVLLALGFPLWFSLLAAVFAVLLSVYVSVWAVVVSLWAADLALILGGLGCLAAGFFVTRGGLSQLLLLFGAGLLLLGLAIFLFFACLALTQGAARLAGIFVRWLKSFFYRKEAVQ